MEARPASLQMGTCADGDIPLHHASTRIFVTTPRPEVRRIIRMLRYKWPDSVTAVDLQGPDRVARGRGRERGRSESPSPTPPTTLSHPSTSSSCWSRRTPNPSRSRIPPTPSTWRGTGRPRPGCRPRESTTLPERGRRRSAAQPRKEIAPARATLVASASALVRSASADGVGGGGRRVAHWPGSVRQRNNGDGRIPEVARVWPGTG
jgi:hypothetical protein